MLSLKQIKEGLDESVLEESLPMEGRLIHDRSGSKNFQAYGLNGECIYSIGRWRLNEILLSEVFKFKKIETHFDHELLVYDTMERILKFRKTTDISTILNYQFDLTVAADGAFSVLARTLSRHARLDFVQRFSEHKYLEIPIPPAKNRQGEAKPRLSLGQFHIWPRGQYMLIALPNRDYSFTATLFGTQELFEQLNSNEAILHFFRTEMSDFLEIIDESVILKAFEKNPLSDLLTIELPKYNYKSDVVAIGDAAHAVVPFLGQGVNAGFEDIRILQNLLTSNNVIDHNMKLDRKLLKRCLDNFSATRFKDLRALQILADENYLEMRSKVLKKHFKLRRLLDAFLSRELGERWLPRYTTIVFRPEISYSEALWRIQKQDLMLNLLIGFIGMFLLALVKLYWTSAITAITA